MLSSRYKHESKLIFWGFFSQVIAINNQTYFIYSQTKDQVFHMCSVGHSITSFFFFLASGTYEECSSPGQREQSGA